MDNIFNIFTNCGIPLTSNLLYKYCFILTHYSYFLYLIFFEANSVSGFLSIFCLWISIVSFFIIRFFPRFYKDPAYLRVLCFWVFLSWVFSCIQCYHSCFNSFVQPPIRLSFGTWMFFNYFSVSWSFLFDPLCCVMMFMVTLISFLIHLYSVEYMSDDANQPLFIIYLTVFTFFMLVLVSAGNIVQFFLGWEGIGLSSYLLIGFWFSRPTASQSALKAIIVNRVGDFSLFLAIGLCYSFYSTTDFLLLKVWLNSNSDFNLPKFDMWINFVDSIPSYELVAFFLVMAALVKSAQFGFHTWLPDAMEGPTPVSALIHAATLVTAGVFLVARCSFIIEKSNFALCILCLFGGLTTFFGSSVGMFQYDIKKIIAYSTCSQLGYMFFACGSSNYDLAVFHLFNHAFFKALLFLCAGSVIHALSNEQDVRKMGGLYNKMPVTFVCMVIGSLSLAGFPFFSGFYSKDLIMESSFFSFTTSGTLGYIFALFSIFTTSFYSIRLLYFVFFPHNKGRETTLIKNAVDPDFFMLVPLIVLSFFSIFGGYLFFEMFVGIGSNFWQSSIVKYFDSDTRLVSEFSNFYIKMTPTAFSICGLFFSFILHYFCSTYFFFLFYNFPNFFFFFKFFNKKWFFDYMYNYFFVKKFLLICYNVILVKFDRGFIEKWFGPRVVIRFSNFFFENLKNEFHSGLIYEYVFYFVCGIVFFSIFVFDTKAVFLTVLFFVFQ